MIAAKETNGMERLMRMYQAIEDIVLTLKVLEADQRVRVMRLVRAELRAGGDLPHRNMRPQKMMVRGEPVDAPRAASGPAKDAPTQQRSAPRYLPRADGPAVRGTYELAQRKGEITNNDVGARWGLTKSGSDQRIQAAMRSGALLRVRHGVYAANPEWKGGAADPPPLPEGQT